MAKKLQYHQKKRLQAQGRCFKCQKKGHLASACTHNPAASLAELPVELLNSICEHLLFPHGDHMIPYIFNVTDLRLTCRMINTKTLDLFASQAFGRLSTNNSFHSFERLVNISKAPVFAAQVRTLGFSHYSGMPASEYEHLKTELREDAEQLDRHQRRELTARIRQADRESNNITFFERSTGDGIMLADAMSRLLNLRDIFIHAPDMGKLRMTLGRKYGSSLPTSTHTFSMLLTCLKFAGIRPHQLRCSDVGRGYNHDAIEIQALAVPSIILKQLQDLTNLDLQLSCSSSPYKNTATWPSHLSRFLQHTPLLARLSIDLEDDFADTSAILDNVASRVHLAYLKDFKIYGLECNGSSLDKFLLNHSQLERLSLEALNIIGPTNFQGIIQTLEQELHCLTFVNFSEIAQDSFRTIFGSLGNVEASEPSWLFADEGERDFFWDFVRVSGPFRHHATIEEWEGVRQKLGLLCADVGTIDRTYHARHQFEQHSWMDRDDDFFDF